MVVGQLVDHQAPLGVADAERGVGGTGGGAGWGGAGGGRAWGPPLRRWPGVGGRGRWRRRAPTSPAISSKGRWARWREPPSHRAARPCTIRPGQQGHGLGVAAGGPALGLASRTRDACRGAARRWCRRPRPAPGRPGGAGRAATSRRSGPGGRGRSSCRPGRPRGTAGRRWRRGRAAGRRPRWPRPGALKPSMAMAVNSDALSGKWLAGAAWETPSRRASDRRLTADGPSWRDQLRAPRPAGPGAGRRRSRWGWPAGSLSHTPPRLTASIYTFEIDSCQSSESRRPTAQASMAGRRARNALPRWEAASLVAWSTSALVRSQPSGTNTGS